MSAARGDHLVQPAGCRAMTTLERACRRVRLLPRHGAIVFTMIAAAALRAVVLVAYRPAFAFPDTVDYLNSASTRRPSSTRPYGYSAFLQVLSLTGSVNAVVIIQHVLGLALVLGGYLLLVHRGVSRLVSCLAVLPLAFDAYILNI
jgi:hypothetical protein